MQKFDAWCNTYEVFSSLRRRWVVIFIALFLVLTGTYFGSGQIPKSYESTATILVEPRQGEGNGPLAAPVDGSRIASLVQLLRSRDTLAMVVERENLSEVGELRDKGNGIGAQEDAIDSLADQVVVMAGEDTAMIYVRGRSTSPELAQRLALAVAEAGMDRRVAMIADDIRQTSDWLDYEIASLRLRVANADQAVANFLERQDIFFNADGRSFDEERMAELIRQINAARERMLLQEAQVKLWRQWQADDDPSLGTLVTIGGNQALVDEYAAWQAESANVLSRLGPNHPISHSVRRRTEEVRAQLAAAADTTIRGAETEVAAGKALIAALEVDLAVARSTVASQLVESPELDALRRQATAQRTVLQDYLSRYESALTMGQPGSILPDMRIVSHPVAPASPIAPPRGLILAAAAIITAMAIVSALVVATMQRKFRIVTA